MSEQDDIHASKIDPNDPSLKLERKKTRKIKQKPVIFVAAVILSGVVMAIVVGLQPKQLTAADDEDTVAVKTAPMVPEMIRLNKGNAAPIPVKQLPAPEPAKPATPDYVPPLGEKLPGDLAYAIREPAQKPPEGANNRADRLAVPQIASVPTGPSEEELERRRERQRAMSGGVFFTSDASGGSNGPLGAVDVANNATQQLLDQYNNVTSGAAAAGASQGLFGGAEPAEPNFGNDANLQSRKNAFLQGQGSRNDGYLKDPLAQPVSPYEVKAGTFIPVSLITGINTDLPGEIIGQVRENVFDTVTGDHLLIPQGSRLMATYDSAVVYGQNRVLVCWNRLIRPDGSSLSLECMPGTDLAGYSGFSDRVKNHWGRIAGGVLLSSVLAVGTARSQGQNIGDDGTIDQVLAGNAAANINDVGQQITEKNLELQPTITIRPGFSVNVLVNKDMVLAPYALAQHSSALSQRY